jgi:hypothetical protein
VLQLPLLPLLLLPQSLSLLCCYCRCLRRCCCPLWSLTPSALLPALPALVLATPAPCLCLHQDIVVSIYMRIDLLTFKYWIINLNMNHGLVFNI